MKLHLQMNLHLHTTWSVLLVLLTFVVHWFLNSTKSFSVIDTITLTKYYWGNLFFYFRLKAAFLIVQKPVKLKLFVKELCVYCIQCCKCSFSFSIICLLKLMPVSLSMINAPYLMQWDSLLIWAPSRVSAEISFS